MNYSTIDAALESLCEDLMRTELTVRSGPHAGEPALRVLMPRTQMLLRRANALAARNAIEADFLSSDSLELASRRKGKRR